MKIMDAYCQSRLTVVGSAKDLKRFYREEPWMAQARHIELLEHSPERHAWQFETDVPPVPLLRAMSREWAGLVFLLDYDCESERVKGLGNGRPSRRSCAAAPGTPKTGPACFPGINYHI
jgi:hypothetical protein